MNVEQRRPATAVLGTIGTLVFSTAVAGGAFLIFVVQPLIAHYILPWFGGGPAVWTTCMLFFQVLLLAGYTYAHALVRWLRPVRQVMVHAVVLLASLCLLPIIPAAAWKPASADHPSLRILLLLARSVGLPYMMLSATGPLLQAWFARAAPGPSPYRLYALSNTASLLGLLAYPLLIEPALSRHAQAIGWSLAMVPFTVLCIAGGLLARKAPADEQQSPVMPASAAPASLMTTRLLWFGLAGVGSTLLLATTNQLCQRIAAVPLLWVLPLTIYLLSFVICFAGPRAYWPTVMRGMLPIVLSLTCWLLLTEPGELSLLLLISCYLAMLLFCCLICHGELYRLRPGAQGLTGFYLIVAAGGAAGGIFVSAIAPVLFTDFYELHGALMALAVLVLLAIFVDPASRLGRGRPNWAWSCLCAGLVILGYVLYAATTLQPKLAVVISRSRNFYGVLAVYEYDTGLPRQRRVLRHGNITHGEQFQAADMQGIATTYYGITSGVGHAIASLPAGPRRIGVVGLGAGTLAAYGRAGDTLRFYEIDPAVARIGRERVQLFAQLPRGHRHRLR